MPSKQVPVSHADPYAALSSGSDEEEEVDIVDVMNEMSTHERRKVYALKGLFNDYKAARAKLHEEIALVQLEHHAKVQRLRTIRSEIIRGVRDITEEEAASLSPVVVDATQQEKTRGVKVVAPQEEQATSALVEAAANPNGGIPEFWLTSMLHATGLEEMITERDRAALRHLQDITTAFIDDAPQKGVVMSFHFSSNPFFTNEVLTKTYHMEFNEDDGDMEISRIEGTEIAWTSAKNNLTVVVKQKKQRHKASKEVRVVEREEKCDSFFNFFDTPKDEENTDEEDEEMYDERVKMDIEAGQMLMEEVVPNAIRYYTGEVIDDTVKQLQSLYGLDEKDDSGDEEENEEDDEEEDEEGQASAGFSAMVSRRGGGTAPASGGRGKGAPAGKPQECKQQ